MVCLQRCSIQFMYVEPPGEKATSASPIYHISRGTRQPSRLSSPPSRRIVLSKAHVIYSVTHRALRLFQHVFFQPHEVQYIPKWKAHPICFLFRLYSAYKWSTAFGRFSFEIREEKPDVPPDRCSHPPPSRQSFFIYAGMWDCRPLRKIP